MTTDSTPWSAAQSIMHFMPGIRLSHPSSPNLQRQGAGSPI